MSPGSRRSCADAALRVRGIVKRFGATRALDGVDLTVAAGEIRGLVGENGAGKSTLLRVLSGALAPDAGELRLEGAPYAPRDPAGGRARGVATIYQELSLAPHLSVEANLVLGVEPRRGPFLDRAGCRELARRALARVGRGAELLGQRAGALPLAERQLVEIARALVIDARLIVLDEPTSSLGTREVEALFALLADLRAEGRAIVYVSHALEEVARLCDRTTILRDGRTVGVLERERFDAGAAVALMVGRDVRALYPRSPRVPGEVLLEVTALAGTRLPAEATLALRRGEVLGIAGLVGAGRTELLRALFGLDAVKRGALRIGSVAGPRAPAERWRHGTGFLAEDRANEGLATGLSLTDNLCLPLDPRLGRAGFVSPRARARVTRAWIERLGIRCRSAAQPVAELSGGNQQKLAFARLLAADVDLALLDEPTRGIDVGAKAELYRRIDALAAGAEGGRARAVLIVSSFLPELLGVCDKVAVMRKGVLGPARPVAELSEHALLAEATGGAP